MSETKALEVYAQIDFNKDMDAYFVKEIKNAILETNGNKTAIIDRVTFRNTSGVYRRQRWALEGKVRYTVNQMIDANLIDWKYGQPLILNKIEWAKYRILSS
jgi:hypothetical protein